MTTPTATPQPTATLTCACGHPAAEHDRVGLRYCQATLSGGLARGCICPAASAVPDGAPGV
jgi:hypothetical protein